MLSRAVNKFKPVFFLQHDWQLFKSPLKYISIVWYICQVNLVDMGNFFGKSVLAIPPEHDILKVRLFIWGHLAIASTEEFHEFTNNPYLKRMGSYCWLGLLMLASEWGMIIKNHDVFSGQPFPLWIKCLWGTLLIGFILGLVKSFWNSQKQEKTPDWNPIDPPIDIIYPKTKKH